MSNFSLKAMASRLGYTELPEKSNVNSTNEDMAKRLDASGGYAQQNRMIQDKRKTLDRVVLYSYQGAKVKKENEEPVRALINPNQVKQSYDDKIISIGFEYGYKPGDVFEWCNTGTHWLIYLQDLTELAYFKGDVRKCSYTINWEDETGKHTSYMAIEGPGEKDIATGVSHGISMDKPNYTISFMVPKNEETESFFKRYQKFYLQEMKDTCWRVEAINSISIPGILRVSAKEYYSNEFEDNLEEGTAGSLIVKPVDPNPQPPEITGEVFIKPKKEYSYFIANAEKEGAWTLSNNKLPIQMTEYVTEEGFPGIQIKWTTSYSGQFDLTYTVSNKIYNKTIVVESLF